MYSYGPSHMAKQKQDDQLEHTYSSYVRIRDVTLKTCQKRWIIGRSDERGSGISLLAARLDDDIYIYIYIYIYIVLPARISLNLSSHSTPGSSSRLRHLSVQSCCIYVQAVRTASARPCEEVYRSMSLLSSSLLHQQFPARLVHLT